MSISDFQAFTPPGCINPILWALLMHQPLVHAYYTFKGIIHWFNCTLYTLYKIVLAYIATTDYTLLSSAPSSKSHSSKKSFTTSYIIYANRNSTNLITLIFTYLHCFNISFIKLAIHMGLQSFVQLQKSHFFLSDAEAWRSSINLFLLQNPCIHAFANWKFIVPHRTRQSKPSKNSKTRFLL